MKKERKTNFYIVSLKLSLKVLTDKKKTNHNQERSRIPSGERQLATHALYFGHPTLVPLSCGLHQWREMGVKDLLAFALSGRIIIGEK